MLKSSSVVHETDNSSWTAQLGKAFIWAFLFWISLISLSFSLFGCSFWFLIPFSLGSGQQVKHPSAFQGWLPIIPQWWKLSESMGMLSALVFSAGYWFSSCKARLCGFKAASPAAELKFAVKTWHRYGLTPVMGQCLFLSPSPMLRGLLCAQVFQTRCIFCDQSVFTIVIDPCTCDWMQKDIERVHAAVESMQRLPAVNQRSWRLSQRLLEQNVQALTVGSAEGGQRLDSLINQSSDRPVLLGCSSESWSIILPLQAHSTAHGHCIILKHR